MKVGSGHRYLRGVRCAKAQIERLTLVSRLNPAKSFCGDL
jgi:hypothetical protein